MTNKKIVITAFAVTLFHFAITAAISYYIAVQIGTQMGEIVASGLIESSDKNPAKADEKAHRIYQNMKNKRDAILGNWKVPTLLISLPVKSLMAPLFQEMRQKQISRLAAKEITREQFKTQGIITDYTATLLNSFSLGLLVFTIMRIVNQCKRRT